MKGKAEHESKDSLCKYYRLELINQIGYIISTLIACVGLFKLEIFLQFADTYKMSIPIVIVIVSILVIYFGGKTYNLLLARDGKGIPIKPL